MAFPLFSPKSTIFLCSSSTLAELVASIKPSTKPFPIDFCASSKPFLSIFNFPENVVAFLAAAPPYTLASASVISRLSLLARTFASMTRFKLFKLLMSPRYAFANAVETVRTS